MSMREIGRALAHYTVVAIPAACAAVVVPIPFDGLAKTAATADAVIVTGWAATVLLDTVTARVKGGRR
ncbi:MAG: hypothetical protein HOY79_01805 [Streptomyces sp.]|nr:hypothetical protein [Streptomyces sp.]